MDLTNPDIPIGQDLLFPRGLLHLHRMKLLWRGCCYERLRVTNYALSPLELPLELTFDADYADIFEVRGTRRTRRGQLLPVRSRPDGLAFAYLGLDGVKRETTLVSEPVPDHNEDATLRFDLRLDPRDSTDIFFVVSCAPGDDVDPPRDGFDRAETETLRARAAARALMAGVRTSNDGFDRWVARSAADITMMTTDTPYGRYPYAGIPWFSTPFGRDGIITALAMLWADPTLALGVLRFLAATQATEADPERDAQPGKILHEAREGEMAALGEVPFGRYYGSVDATPLFVLLAGRFFDRTGDLATIQSLWPNIEAALGWMDNYGDLDRDGFIEYARSSERGLVHQGWKDSHDAIFHADGTPAEGPIALCEVQGYAYAARHHAAELAFALGDGKRGKQLQRQAEDLHALFEQRFWCESLGGYSLALDGHKRPCQVLTSNAGQCLLSGIATPQHAEIVADAMLSSEMYSGWGIRTVRAGEPRYNPMSYHNGSIWPHDTALIAAGLARYGFSNHVVRIVTGLFDASMHLDLHRLPELFCGFDRSTDDGPTKYPVACAPQAWASASVYLLLQCLLGLEVDGRRRRLVFRQPRLPESVDWLRLTNITLGAARVDVLCERRGDDVGISVLRRVGDIAVATEK